MIKHAKKSFGNKKPEPAISRILYDSAGIGTPKLIKAKAASLAERDGYLSGP
jgi:hypothetical protein